MKQTGSLKSFSFCINIGEKQKGLPVTLWTEKTNRKKNHSLLYTACSKRQPRLSGLSIGLLIEPPLVKIQLELNSFSAFNWFPLYIAFYYHPSYCSDMTEVLLKMGVKSQAIHLFWSARYILNLIMVDFLSSHIMSVKFVTIPSGDRNSTTNKS